MPHTSPDHNQLTFKKHKSTVVAGATLTHKILHSLDSPPKTYVCCFPDSTPNFSIINRNEICNGLSSLGVDKRIAGFMTDCLSNRSYFCALNKQIYDSFPNDCDDSQFSYLIPFTFSPYAKKFPPKDS